MVPSNYPKDLLGPETTGYGLRWSSDVLVMLLERIRHRPSSLQFQYIPCIETICTIQQFGAFASTNSLVHDLVCEAENAAIQATSLCIHEPPVSTVVLFASGFPFSITIAVARVVVRFPYRREYGGLPQSGTCLQAIGKNLYTLVCGSGNFQLVQYVYVDVEM